MKDFDSLFCVFLALVFTALPLQAGTVQTAQSQSAVITSRGPNSRTWTITNTNRANAPSSTSQTSKPRQVVELATGMHFWNGTNWEISNPSFFVTTNGFVANQTQHKVRLSPDIFVQGAVQVLTRDGLLINSSPVAIALYDAASGNSLIIAHLTNSTGVQISSNQIVYPNAFNGVCANVMYTMQKGSFQQDVIFTGRVDPVTYGFPSNTTRLQVITEYYNPPSPQIRQNTLKFETNQAIRSMMVSPDLIDQTLGFGEFVLVPGRAYLAGVSNPVNGIHSHGAPVGKAFISQAGRYFLIESVEYKNVYKDIQSLPDCNASSTTASTASIQKGNGIYASLPSIPKPIGIANANSKSATAFYPPFKASAPSKIQSKNTSTQLAENSALNHGFVLDYIAVITGSTNDEGYLFQGDTTYYISDAFVVAASATIESGAVLKYAPPVYFDADGNEVLQPGSLNIFNGLICPSDSYHPAVFTAVDDDSVGESLSGIAASYSGGPSGGYGNGYLIQFVVHPLSNMRFCYAATALRGYQDASTLTNVQFVNCDLALEIDGSDSSPMTFNNCLFANVVALFWDFNNAVSANFNNCTFDQCSQLNFGIAAWGYSPGPFGATNSIFSNMGVDWTQYPITGDFNAFYNNVNTFGYDPTNLPASPFQTVGGGNYYLATNTVQGLGTTNLDAALLAELRRKTTCPPEVFADQVMSTNQVLPLYATRDTNGIRIDLGYHYAPIDYAFGGVTVSNATLLLTNGAVIAAFDDSGSGYGLTVGPGAQFISVGTPLAMNRVVAFNNVQEEPGYTSGWFTPTNALILPNTTTNGPGSYMYCRFTDFSVLAQETAHISHPPGGNSQPLLLQDSQFHGGFLSTSNATIGLVNCLLERVQASFEPTDGNSTQIRNCLFWHGSLDMGLLYSNSTFLNNELYVDMIMNNSGSSYISDYNFYYNTSYNSLGPILSHDHFTLTDPGFQTGLLGNYYQPAGNLLINNGNITADQLGLYFYTTQTNQVPETNSPVDIGYHYVALGTNGFPIQSSGYDLPNYLKYPSGLTVIIQVPPNGSSVQ